MAYAAIKFGLNVINISVRFVRVRASTATCWATSGWAVVRGLVRFTLSDIVAFVVHADNDFMYIANNANPFVVRVLGISLEVWQNTIRQGNKHSENRNKKILVPVL